MFASGYWYQYDSIVFEVPRFLGYIYLYEFSDGLYIQILVKRTYHISYNEMVSTQREYSYGFSFISQEKTYHNE